MTPKEKRVRALLARDIEWPCDESAVEMIALEEDCRLTAYQDDGGVWTCGWGETDGVQAGADWTQDYADERLRRSLLEWTEGVQRALGGAYANANQLAAMLCLAYNIGLAAFAKSTVCRLHKAGDYAGAARAFALWNKVRDRTTRKLRPHPALEARRAREAARYLEPVSDAVVAAPMPQAVQPESSLARSPIAASGAAATATGVASILAQAGDQVGAVGTTLKSAKTAVVETLGVPDGAFLPIVLVISGAVAMYWRRKQRQGGWA